MDGKRAFLALACLVLAAGRTIPQPPADPVLDGKWEITSLIDNGDSLAPIQIRSILSADGRITIEGNTIHFMQAGTGKKRLLAYVTDCSKTPYQIDLAGTRKGASQGIFTVDRDLALVCLGTGPERPTNFVCMPGSGTMLLTLKRVPADPAYSPPPAGLPAASNPPATGTVATSGLTGSQYGPALDAGTHTAHSNLRPPVSPTLPPAGAVPPPPPPTAPRVSDAELKARLPGTWGYQDERKVATTTFNVDGTFSGLFQWKSALRKVFAEDLRVSGTWNIEGGVLVARVSAATEREFMGQIYSCKISTLSDGRLIGTDGEGKLHMEWRIR